MFTVPGMVQAGVNERNGIRQIRYHDLSGSILGRKRYRATAVMQQIASIGNNISESALRFPQPPSLPLPLLKPHSHVPTPHSHQQVASIIYNISDSCPPPPLFPHPYHLTHSPPLPVLSRHKRWLLAPHVNTSIAQEGKLILMTPPPPRHPPPLPAQNITLTK